ncbi:MAG: hypothetical protein R2683_01375 [Bifidobacterium adolescentis]
MPVSGEITMRKTVFLPPSDAGKPALLRLGTMNDADHTWVNGVLVGGRSNVYEPRDYPVAAGVLRSPARTKSACVWSLNGPAAV